MEALCRGLMQHTKEIGTRIIVVYIVQRCHEWPGKMARCELDVDFTHLAG